MSFQFDIRVGFSCLLRKPLIKPIFVSAYKDTIETIGRLDVHNPILLTSGTSSLNLQSDCAATPFLAGIIEEMSEQFDRYGSSDLYDNLNDQIALARAIIVSKTNFEPVQKKASQPAHLSARIAFPIPIQDFTLRQEESFEITRNLLTDRDVKIDDKIEHQPKIVEVSSSLRDRYMVGKLVMQWAASQIGEDKKITKSAVRSYYEDAQISALGRDRASHLHYAHG